MYILKVYLIVIHRDKTHVLQKIPFFLSWTPTHHSFTFNLWFLYELKHKVSLPKTVCGIIRFWFRFVFIKAYIFVQQNPWTLLLKNAIITFKIRIIEKPQTVLLLVIWFLSCNKKFENSMIPVWVGAPQKMTWRQCF